MRNAIFREERKKIFLIIISLKTLIRIINMDHHRQSFFGQKTGLLLDSANIADPFIYIRFLQKKPTGQWEKPSLKEGKSIKLNLLELIQILRVLSSNSSKWTTVHKFGDENTSISVEHANNTVNFYVSGYNKYFKFPETKLFMDLLQHIYNEKIEKATGGNHPGTSVAQRSNILSNTSQNQPVQSYVPKEKAPSALQSSKIDSHSERLQQLKNTPVDYPEELDAIVNSSVSSPTNQFTPEEWFNALQHKDDFRLVPGDIIRQSSKATAFQILGRSEIWVPNSCVDNVNDNSTQGLWIKEWFLKKKMDDIFSAPV